MTTLPLRSKLERQLGWIILAVLPGGCLLVVRPFVSALLWGMVLSVSSWPLYRRLVNLLGGRRPLAAALMALAMICRSFSASSAARWCSVSSACSSALRCWRLATGWWRNGPPIPARLRPQSLRRRADESGARLPRTKNQDYDERRIATFAGSSRASSAPIQSTLNMIWSRLAIRLATLRSAP